MRRHRGARSIPNGHAEESMSSSLEYLEQIYRVYRDWKHSYRVVRPAAERELYTREFARIAPPANGRVLELGFGEGLFLDWARDRVEFAITGTV